jgi:hypothetical protein
MMLDALLAKLETDLRAASEVNVTLLVATARTQLEHVLGEAEKERTQWQAEIEGQLANAMDAVGIKRAELEQEMEAMQTHKAQQEGRVQLNVGGYRYETSVQTLRRVPGNFFDAYFSGRYAQDACEDGSIFIDRDGMLFGHVLQYLRDDVVAVVEQGELPRVGLLRRLKREFSYFSIELYVDQADGAGQADLFDTLIAAAEHTRQAHSEASDDDAGKDEDECSMTADERGKEATGMTADERSQEASRRNKARRDAEGDAAASSKWCTKCFEDKPLDDFYESMSTLFGRRGLCKVCHSDSNRARRRSKREEDEEMGERKREGYEEKHKWTDEAKEEMEGLWLEAGDERGENVANAEEAQATAHAAADGEDETMPPCTPTSPPLNQSVGRATAGGGSVKKEDKDEETETDDDDDNDGNDGAGDENDGTEDENEVCLRLTAAERSKEATRRNQARRDTEGDAATSKWCTQCYEDKDLDAFFNGSNSNGNIFNRVADCKECRSKFRRIQRTQNKKVKIEASKEESVTGKAELEREASKMMADKRAQEISRRNKAVYIDREATAAERSKEATRRNQARRDTEGDSAMSKWCSKCFDDRPLDDFNQSTTMLLGRRGYCKDCTSSERKGMRRSKKDGDKKVASILEKKEREDEGETVETIAKQEVGESKKEEASEAMALEESKPLQHMQLSAEELDENEKPVMVAESGDASEEAAAMGEREELPQSNVNVPA